MDFQIDEPLARQKDKTFGKLGTSYTDTVEIGGEEYMYSLSGREPGNGHLMVFVYGVIGEHGLEEVSGDQAEAVRDSAVVKHGLYSSGNLEPETETADFDSLETFMIDGDRIYQEVR